MAPDNRDRNFEKALARQLRSSASSTPDAGSPAGASASPLAGLCPDPEMLAAYHDGSLSPEERNLWKNHVLSCDNCQLVLAHLATPLDIPVHLDAKENVLVTQQRVASAKTASPAPIARPSPLHSLRWLWLVPAGAIAAALIAWVSLQAPKPLPGVKSSPVEVAENRQPLADASSPKPATALPRERKEKDQPAASSADAVGGVPAGKREDALKEPQNLDQLVQQAPSQNAAPPAHGPYLSQQKQQQQINRLAAGSAGAVDEKKLDTQSASNKLPFYSRQAPATQPPPPPPPAALEQPSFVADGAIPPAATAKVAPPAPAPVTPANSREVDSSSTTAETMTSTSTGASAALEVSAAPQSLAKTRSMMRAAALQNPHVIGAPGGKQLWRLGPAGSLEHSKDKGLNWMPQISGVYTDLLAGSAPSARVCWIVGVSGTILRTTDGGTHWTKLDSPVTNDLTGVRATDATHAVIWSVPDPQTGLIKIYQTSDGGVTWSPASNP